MQSIQRRYEVRIGFTRKGHQMLRQQTSSKARAWTILCLRRGQGRPGPESSTANPGKHAFYVIIITFLPYVPGEVRMDPKTEVCLYPFGVAAGGPIAMGGIPPESQFSWLSGRYLIVPF
jgi:hypothetical protein